MTTLPRWLRALWPHNKEAEDARERVTEDRVEIERQASRIERGTDALQKRVYTENHISAAIAAILKGHR